jgi:hypothetical protein
MWDQNNEQFWWFFQNFKKVGFLKTQISKILWMVCATKQRRKIRSHSDPRMKLSIRGAKIMNSFFYFFPNYKKVGFLKIQISKIFWITLKWKIYENWSLDISNWSS